MTAYPFKEFERKWQKAWADTKAFDVRDDTTKPKSYILEMLPYPSGRLHMGHVRNYAIGDAIARYKRAQGYAVLHPMGWDAFGLPAENAAAERQVDPAVWTVDNIKTMKEQLQSLGFSFDWAREVSTCDPGYYAHEQKIFLDFWRKGLAYRKEIWVNWDPVEGSVLANEQVINGRGWRSGAIVEKRKLTQWSLQITRYAQELLDDLAKLEEGWPEKVIRMQENWIGRSEGASLRFALADKEEEAIEVFTTRPETLFGAAFCAVSPAHPLTESLLQTNPALAEFVAMCQRTPTMEEALSTEEKQGFDTGLRVHHPFIPGHMLPVYVANFVMMDYGTGAVFGCPAHDERDFDFAIKYGLPVTVVVQPEGEEPLSLPLATAYTGAGTLTNAGFLDGLSIEKARTRAIEEIERRQIGARRVTYRLRDWCISRQRYWGCPIPVIYCETCGPVPVPDQDLPVILPKDVIFGQGGNPLANHPTWKHVNCPQCGKAATRETDTFDTFVESSWYFLRYCNPSTTAPIDKEACQKWMPVDWYIGGVEHAVLHLLYARFFTKALRDCGYVNLDEPFQKLLTQGMVCHQTFQGQDGQWLYPQEVEKTQKGHYVTLKDGASVTVGRSEKMSKSRKNVVDPQSIIDTYGTDAARLFVLSDTPPERDFDWNDEGLEGAWRYINRVWRLTLQTLDLADRTGEPEPTLMARKFIHQSIRKFQQAYERNAFNKAIAFLRELTNALEKHLETEATSRTALIEGVEVLVRGLGPIIPHLASELWSRLGHTESLVDAPWPVPDPELAMVEEVTIAVQVNGKMRGSFQAAMDTEASLLEQEALKLPAIVKDMAGRVPRRMVTVPNRIVNIVM
ncbi:MAG: leucyl-tRNA synthetase [Alphaproteobacteria bacterium]|jgi:leucyl-tRNA synthetase|nr:leucyl-tRNA synthetase [Alphaproteobacteria bacterium]